MNYSEEFKKAVEFCFKQKLFLGYGNPNGKVLIIGKEQYYKSKEKCDSDEFYQDLNLKRDTVNDYNINSWLRNIHENFKPDWVNLINIKREEIDINPQTIYWQQKNAQNKLLKNKKWNNGTSSTYLN